MQVAKNQIKTKESRKKVPPLVVRVKLEGVLGVEPLLEKLFCGFPYAFPA